MPYRRKTIPNNWNMPLLCCLKHGWWREQIDLFWRNHSSLVPHVTSRGRMKMARFWNGAGEFAESRKTKYFHVKMLKIIFTLIFTCLEFPQFFLGVGIYSLDLIFKAPKACSFHNMVQGWNACKTKMKRNNKRYKKYKRRSLSFTFVLLLRRNSLRNRPSAVPNLFLQLLFFINGIYP